MANNRAITYREAMAIVNKQSNDLLHFILVVHKKNPDKYPFDELIDNLITYNEINKMTGCLKEYYTNKGWLEDERNN